MDDLVPSSPAPGSMNELVEEDELVPSSPATGSMDDLVPSSPALGCMDDLVEEDELVPWSLAPGSMDHLVPSSPAPGSMDDLVEEDELVPSSPAPGSMDDDLVQLQLHGGRGDRCTGPAESGRRPWWWRRCHDASEPPRNDRTKAKKTRADFILYCVDRFAIPTKHTGLFILVWDPSAPWKERIQEQEEATSVPAFMSFLLSPSSLVLGGCSVRLPRVFRASTCLQASPGGGLSKHGR
jgi:hypothetical protein